MNNFRIIVKNGDNILGGIHSNSSEFDRLLSSFANDLCPHGIYLYNEECPKGCHLLINDRLYLPNKNVSFLLEKKILGETITFWDRVRPIICKIKHSKITTDEIVYQGKSCTTHSTLTSCKRCGIWFKKSVWDE